MTIKQYGGVFGRNPTFNDVTIEGQLTFDGDIDVDSDLKVDGNLDVTGTSNLAAIAGTGNVVLGNTVTNPASNYATQQGFGWNNSTKVLELSSSAGALQLGRTSGGGDGQVLVIRQAANVAAEIRVEGNTGYFKPSNGGGIDFSATAGTGTSEILDDYEEGVWTPSLGGTATYHVREASYVKVGALVQFKATIAVNAIGTGSATTITGLPYLNGDGIPATNIAVMTNSATSVVYVVGSIVADGSTITMRGLTTAGTSMTIPNIFGNGTYVEMSGSYSTLT